MWNQGKFHDLLIRICLSEFAFKDKIKLSYTEVNDYDPDKPRTPLVFGEVEVGVKV